MKWWEKIKKRISPEDEESFDDNVFEADEIYDARDGGTGNIDIGNFVSSGKYSPYVNANQSGINQVQQTRQQSYTPESRKSGGITVSGSGSIQPFVEFKVVKPEDYNNPSEIADYLLNGKTVILNLEETTVETARRLKDYLCGVAYSIHGNIERVSSKTFVVTPKGIIISSDSSDRLKGSARRNAGTDSFGIPKEARN